jgi:predicted DNA-binding transcriptional regulator YafY
MQRTTIEATPSAVDALWFATARTTTIQPPRRTRDRGKTGVTAATTAKRSSAVKKPASKKTTAKKPTKSRTPSPAPRSDRSKRLLDLVMLLLRARSPVTFREIREQFPSYKTRNVEAGLRAFERDKADLLDLGVPIRYVTPDEDDAIEEGGYVVELNRYWLPEVHLTTEEVSALFLAASVARAVPGGSYGQIVDLALKKLAFDMPELPDTPLELLATPDAAATGAPVLVHFPDAHGRKTQRELSDRFSQLEAATRNRKRVTLRYRSASRGMVQSRDVDPYGLAYRQGAWLLIGYCHLRQDVRSFRLDRILDLHPAPRPKSPDFDRPASFDIRRYVGRSPWLFATGAEEDVELELCPEVASVANEDFGADAERAELPGGGVLVRFHCGNLDYAVSRILAAKGAIRVHHGPRLRDRLTSELNAIGARYP